MRKQDKSRDSESVEAGSTPPQILAPAASRPIGNDAEYIQNLNSDNQCEVIPSSSCGDRKGRVPEMARPLCLQCRDCEELIHQLSNVITPILMHAQMLEWKLPPYSHLKRPVRELERNARRGSELVKALMRRAGDGNLGAVVGPIAADSGDRTASPEEGRRPHKRL